jgi:hypothetical protein
MWAMLRALINNNCPIVTINGILFPVTNGVFGTFAGQAGKGSLLIDYANAILYINTGTLASPLWTTVPGGLPGGIATGQDDALVYLTTNGAIPTNVATAYVLNKAGALSMTLAAPIAGPPSAGGNDGLEIKIVAGTPYVDVISAIGLLETGTAAMNYITFSGYAGAVVDLMALGGKWVIWNSNGVSFQ